MAGQSPVRLMMVEMPMSVIRPELPSQKFDR